MKIQATKVYKEIEKAVNEGFTTISEQGASRSGKTRNTCIFLVVYAMTHKNKCISVVRATQPAISRSVFRDFKEVLIDMGLPSEKMINKSTFIITFSTGSFIEFFSADNEQKIRGSKRDILYVNEANELIFIKWQQLKMRTTEFSIIDYNPSFSDDHWICQVNQEPKTYHFITTYKDNPFLEQTIVDEIESLQWKNPSLWQVYGLGQMAIVEGLVFPNIEIIETIDNYKKKHRYLGVDFGYTSDPTAIVDVCFFKNEILIDEVCYNTEMLTSDITRTLKDYEADVHRKFEIISESADPRLITEIYNAGLNIYPVRKYSGSIMAGINKMKEYKIMVTKRSTNIIKEFKNYTYLQDKDGKWMNQPIDCFNHGIDAVRYSVLEKVLGGQGRGLTASQIAGIL